MVTFSLIIILILFILNSINLMSWFIPIKKKMKKAMYVKSALPLQKGHIKRTVAPNEA